MADDVDVTVEREEAMRAQFQAEVSARASKNELPRTGLCHWCEEELDPVFMVTPEGKKKKTYPLFCPPQPDEEISSCMTDYQRSTRP